MKILHLNTHSYGGAAMVARRLHRAGLASGIESTFMTKYGLRSDPTEAYHALRNARLLYSLRERAQDPRLYRIGKAVQQKMQHRNLVNRPAGLEIFSPLNTRPQFADCTDSIDPNVVHLHWVAGFVDHAEFFHRNRHRKFVWTLHDMNPFTGGCHHADGCAGFTNTCADCPQLAGTIDRSYARAVLGAKADALAGLRDDQLTIVAPSLWLLELARQSAVTRRFRHVHIANPTFSRAQPEAPATLRKSLGLPTDKKIVLFIADNLRNPRKRVPLLLDAVKLLPEVNRIQLVGIGQKADTPAGLAVRFTGTITDEQVLANYLGSADVLVSASIAENSPLTVIEALSCGTPVVAYGVGGIPELVGESDGAVVRDDNVQALADALDDVLFRREYDRAGIAARAERHAPAAVLGHYRAVYEELLAS
jgi:glycosyltransferase involved in cell wall biosynthesis